MRYVEMHVCLSFQFMHLFVLLCLTKVLVVDDSDLNRKMICKALVATKEFQCEQAVDGSVAVQMVKSNLSGQYDIILMDYQMPVMDGPTAISEIRKLGYKYVPVYVCM
jgi:CheY-like chemotaxis protein